MATLKEATLSHHVSTQPRPTQPLGSSSTSSSIRPVEKMVKSPVDSQLDRRSGRKKKAQEGGLLSFFKPLSEREDRAPPRRKEGTVHMTTAQSVHSTDMRQNITAQVSLETSTVVLLEEVSVLPPLLSLSPYSLLPQVDILFESDRGFWSGVYDVIDTSRRPIILTCNGTASHNSVSLL